MYTVDNLMYMCMQANGQWRIAFEIYNVASGWMENAGVTGSSLRHRMAIMESGFKQGTRIGQNHLNMNSMCIAEHLSSERRSNFGQYSELPRILNVYRQANYRVKENCCCQRCQHCCCLQTTFIAPHLLCLQCLEMFEIATEKSTERLESWKCTNANRNLQFRLSCMKSVH